MENKIKDDKDMSEGLYLTCSQEIRFTNVWTLFTIILHLKYLMQNGHLFVRDASIRLPYYHILVKIVRGKLLGRMEQ